jgi:cell division protease FtsH
MKSLMVWGGIFLALLLVVSMFGPRAEPAGTGDPLFRFPRQGAEGSVAEVQIAPNRIVGKLKNGDTFTTVPVPNDTILPSCWRKTACSIPASRPEEGNVLLYILIQTAAVPADPRHRLLRAAPGAEGRRIAARWASASPRPSC